jgi:hypothetical protein
MSNNIHSHGEPRDEEIWNIARKRTAFRRHLFTYLVVNSFLWIIWVIRSGEMDSVVPWPVWPTLGWGVALALNYADAYMFHRENSVEQEYQKLLRKKQQK